MGIVESVRILLRRYPLPIPHLSLNIPRNPAPADSAILESILNRWSPLAFSDHAVEPEKIAAFFEAARWAPSSYNEQPWRYLYALKGDSIREALEGLHVWAKNAGVLVLSFAKNTFARSGKENRHALHDTGCASGYIALQLSTLGLVGHQMSGFDQENANRILGVPEEFTPGSMIAIGYPGDHMSLPEDLQKREESPRTRNPVPAFAFRGTWQG
jgi:nitroreductase